MTAYDYIRDGDTIDERPFAIIRAEADLSRFSPPEADVAIRMIHAGGDFVAHFAKHSSNDNARAIVEGHISPSTAELPLHYPFTTEIGKDHADYKTQNLAFYEKSAAKVAAHISAGCTVAVLPEGDPLFYGSYMHLHARLATASPHKPFPVSPPCRAAGRRPVRA